MTAPPVASFQHHIDAFRRHRGKAIGFFLAVVAVAVGVLLFLPGTYESESILYVRLGRESVTLDPIATTGQTMAITDSREYEINTVAEVLSSDVLGEGVVNKIGTDRILRDELGLREVYAGKGLLGDAKYEVAKVLKRLRGSGKGTDAERARKIVMGGVSVHATPKSSIIAVRTQGETPELARDLNLALVDQYLESHLAMHRNQGSVEFFREQRDHLNEQLTETESELRDVKNAGGIITIEGKRQALQQKADLVGQEQLRVEAELAATNAHVESLESLLAKIPERVTTLETSGLPNLARDGMREELYRLEIQLQDLLSRKTEAHPDVVSTKKQIEEARAILKTAPEERSQAATDVNKTYQSLMYDLMRQQALKASYERELQMLSTQDSAIVEQIDDVNQEQMKVQELERRGKLLASSYQTYVEKLELARIASELHNDRISNVHVVQAPSLSSRPASPNKPLLLVASVLLAAIGSYLLVALCDAMDQQLRHPEEVEDEIGIPVFATLPRTSRRHASLN